ncbi:cholesterol transport system auxiliary component [Alkalispirillum mobile]|uniref:Cholesterol transport system auxiliary component n=1 Tax=Alkalispirillum mobile TaxID=85925 RepID=A0A498CB01_9GAMM|nr:ABC-type transport auxiliary lipoprotein family protein [Alkalispirillum mobile]RLK50170.1 cholesterol transport system auxiliary component [Alkalispirillum mobile]
MSHRLTVPITALALALLLTGCGLMLPEPAETPRTYSLSWNPDDRPRAEDPIAGAVRIMPTQAQPGYTSTAMRYRRDDWELQRFAHHKWVEPPARMLTPALVTALEHDGPFEQVVHGSGVVSTPLRLHTELERLEHRFEDDDDPGRVLLTLRLQLLDGDAGRVVTTQRFHAEVPADTRDPVAGARAANLALAELLPQITDHLRESLESR